MMMVVENSCSSTGFSSPRSDAFPAGLRVLVVDDDPTWLKILEKMLKKCSYEVTTCGLAREALDLLRERKDGFDIVISDVNMPDMDGFKLLEHVGLEMDLPVIMMSVDGETSRVMKGVQHGACDYLLKPIRMKELRNIWQHVFRKRIHEVRDIEFHDEMDEIHMIRNGSDQYEDRHLPCGSDPISGKKRRDVDYKHDDRDSNDPSSVKRARVVWTVELHQKFVRAVNQIGFEKVGPKKILDLMGVPWLTRENVASHLQKYRLYLGRLPKEKELTGSFGGMKHSDVSAMEPNVSRNIQNLVNKQRCDLKSSNYSIHGNRSMMQKNVDFKIHEGDMKCSSIASVPAAEPKNAITGDDSFGHSDLDVKNGATIPEQYPTTGDEECSRTQTSLECKPHFQPNSRFNPLPLSTSSLNPGFSKIEREKIAEAEMKPAYTKCRSQGTAELSAMRNVDLSAQPVKQTNGQAVHSSPVGLWSMNHNRSLDQILEGSVETAGRSQNLASGLALRSWDDNLQCGPLEGEYLPFDIVPDSIDSLNYSSPELTAEVPAFLYDSLNYEYPFDPIEYPVIDQGLFIV